MRAVHLPVRQSSQPFAYNLMSRAQQDAVSTQVQEPQAENNSLGPVKERKKSTAVDRIQKPVYDDNESDEEQDFIIPKPRKNRRMVPFHQSRIADRPIKKGAEDSSLKIKIELDLEVEVISVSSPL